jgi:hypothetical protein|tara:strand:- start:2700 stop:2885 length:186 start_codon:yes stop_codon:yes gene_type:complete
MQFERNTRAGSLNVITKLAIKFILLIVVVLIAVVLIDRIDFPSPNKIYEKVVPNENFKIVK